MNMLQRNLRMGVFAGMGAASLGVLSLGACSNMTGGSQGTHTAAATQPTVAPEMVRQVQSKLRDGGYYKQGTVDGVWGSGTEAAVRSFQHDHNLSSNGQLDVPTLQALNLAGVAPATDTMTSTQSNAVQTQPMPADTSPAATNNSSTSTVNPPTSQNR